jgi:peptidoglycan/LPS O-acetylase OafA/YrhL
MIPKKTEFNTIDALRFFAFLKIYLLHLPVDRDFPIFSTLKKGGGIGVVFFFVLSGFLITYILTFDKQNKGAISLPHFYARRILRIWPLFFLFLLIAYLLPHPLRDLLGFDYGGYTPDWRWSFAFLENYQIIRHHIGPSIGPLLLTWSLCIEEHFYIVWAIAVAIMPVRRIPWVMGAFIVTAICARVACMHYLPQYDISTNELVTSMDYFACGGLVGYLYATNKDAFDKRILSIPLIVRGLYLAFAVVFVFFQGQMLQWLHVPAALNPFIHSVIFAGVIAVVIPPGSEISIGPRNVLSYLGRISYGLYLFHIMVILATLKFFERHHIRIDSWGTLCLNIAITFSVSVLIASFFYHFFEKPFIRLKKYL